MTMTTLIEALFSTQSPLLPHPWAAKIYLALSWGVVLAWGVLWLAQRLDPRHVRLGSALALAVLLWCLWPGPASPSYWLGLAFRAPSLLTLMLCATALLAWHRPAWQDSLPLQGLRPWAPAWVLLGWVLLLDTLAVWPPSVYALGFAPATVGVVMLLAWLPWLLRGATQRPWALTLGVVILLHVFLRLPTGNVWDALLDPWLWLVLQFQWLAGMVRYWRQRAL